MAKQNPKAKTQQSQPLTQTIQLEKPAISFPSWLPYAIIFAFTFLIYSNTLWNRYAIDDTIVVTDNKYTKKGFGGIKDHFTHDMFEGFFGERGAKLVSGGRYRPLSMVSLAIEYEIMRKIRGDKRDVIDDKNIIMSDNDPYLNPFLSHLINIILFAATGLVLYYLLMILIPQKKNTAFYISLPFIITMLYMGHPIHTEAVANIKGRDEVMCMLFSLLALLASVKYVKTQKVGHLIWGGLIFFIALLSKENAITFLAVVPLTLYFFTNAKIKDHAITTGLYFIATVIFLVGLRAQFTQSGITQDSPEILNNPFVPPYNEFGVRYGTTFFTFLIYYWLMLFPHPLTHDYYFNQLGYNDMASAKFFVPFLLTLIAVGYALYALKKKNLASYGILFFFITFSVASNMLFTVGVLMNERFIYMSSLGFCILLAYLLVRYIKSPKALAGVVLVILLLYSGKTFTRNYDWYDSFTLFRRDVKHSYNSAKIQTSVGGDLTKAAAHDIKLMKDSGAIYEIFRDLGTEEEARRITALPDSLIRYHLLDSSIAHLRQAVNIYSTHSNAWLLLGNAIYQRNHKGEEVVDIYQKAGAYRVGGYYDAYFNLGVVYNDMNRPDSARANLLRAFATKPDQVEVRFLLAQIYAKLNQPDSVEAWLKIGSEMKPIDAGDYYSVGTAFGKSAGNFPMAIAYLNKAVEMNPKVELYYEDLAVAYGLSGNIDMAIATSEKLIALNPKYPAAYMNLSVSYRNKGNMQKSKEYLDKYNELTGQNIQPQ